MAAWTMQGIWGAEDASRFMIYGLAKLVDGLELMKWEWAVGEHWVFSLTKYIE